MQSTTAICPSLFNAAIAQDGILSRIRIPCGIISRLQVKAIAHLVQQYGNPNSPHAVQITNRANLQIRSDRPLSLEMLHYLQVNGLAARDQRLDGLRNIMTSPTAGIDPQALIDPRPYAQQWEDYLISHPELAILSAKFSVCFDGGELVNVADRPNDICLVAIAQNDIGVNPKIYFHLHLGIGDRGSSPTPTGILIEPSQAITYLAAFTEIYREYTQQFLANAGQHQLGKHPKPPRLRQLIKDWGIDSYHQPLTTIPNHPLPITHYQSPITNHPYNHLGIHPQKTSPNPNLQQSDLVYIGVVIPLGRLSIGQLMGLSQIAQTYGSSSLRLTPWQNIIITDIPKNQVDLVVQAIADLGLTIATTDPYAAIVACSGCTGCKSAHTDTQSDAQSIATHLHESRLLSQPINIHFSGCDKSCAQHYPSDIALVGIPSPERSLYRVYVGDRETHFGTELYAEYAATDLPQLITELISTYHTQSSKLNLHQNLPSFREFANTLTHA